MREILITSSVLIAALLLLRLLFRSAISRRVQYGLWALVLVRLLVPVTLPAIPLSILNAVQTSQAAVTQAMEQNVYVLPVNRAPAADYPQAARTRPGGTVPTGDSFGYPVLSMDGQTVTKYAQRLTIGEVLTRIWLVGIAGMTVFFLAGNLRFWMRLRRGRTPYDVVGRTRPVYLCEGIASPCLFGFPRPAVYLTPAAVSSPERLRHVLAHEETHARHLDPLWSLLRCICLAVYWFDPLVWAAAIVAKTDCELACDESTLLRLGEGERIPYGQTLLSLIPVRRGIANPLLTATTMTAGKRQLRDRIARIAQRRRTLTAALAAVTALALAVGACTFTGAEPRKTGPQPLTSEELCYFNEDFFNGDLDDGASINIRNQFLSSHYEKPEEIDLYALFYCNIPTGEPGGDALSNPSDEEQILAFGGIERETSPHKLTTAQMDSLLKKYTGLTVAETANLGLENFTYLAEYDAYYLTHGDTNYRRNVTISAGTRVGNTVQLYYDDDFGILGGRWNCVTLREAEGGYQFISNLPSKKPKIPVVLPDRTPELTIQLENLSPYESPAVTVERHTGDFAERLAGWSVGEHSIYAYRSTDGKIYVAVEYDSATGPNDMSAWDMGCFLTLDGGQSPQLDLFSDLFGHSGITVSYSANSENNADAVVYDYYYIDESGVPVLLARTEGDSGPPAQLDLNGDGEDELVGDDVIFFAREGEVYEARLHDLVQAAWPEMSYGGWVNEILNPYGRYLALRCLVEKPDWGDGIAEAQRYLYFDGKALLLYKGGKTADHVLVGVAGAAEVLAAAKVQGARFYADIKNGNAELMDQRYDDWRISALDKLDIKGSLEPWSDLDVEFYRFGFELHTAEPQEIGFAGGSYIDEDGWFGGFWSSQISYYLLFEVRDGTRRLLESNIPSDLEPGSRVFQEALAKAMDANGLTPS